jgi:hypothetical protein
MKRSAGWDRALRLTFAVSILVLGALAIVKPARTAPAASFNVEQIKGYPFPNELTAALSGSRIAWAFDERGSRNIWVAEGPEFRPRRLTSYETDD